MYIYISDIGLLTMSTLPKSRWQQLPILDLVKQRNKPKEAPKAPVNAPFFLSVTAGLTPQMDPSQLIEDQKKRDMVRVCVCVCTMKAKCTE